jgi:hypothetical protein
MGDGDLRAMRSYIDSAGYVRVLVDGVYELEHRVVMSAHLGRPLRAGERVHRRPGVSRRDNRIENLILRGRKKHCPTCTCGR